MCSEAIFRWIYIDILSRCILNLNSAIYFQVIVIFDNFPTILILSHLCFTFNEINLLYQFPSIKKFLYILYQPRWLSGRALDKKFSLFSLSGRTLVRILAEDNLFGLFWPFLQDRTKFDIRKRYYFCINSTCYKGQLQAASGRVFNSIK